MKIYQVGGAVRDELLGLAVKDRDHVVVGATPEEMERLGYKPVGKDFPVFLHPQTYEEYALARTERKTGRGYKGFTVHAAPEVTLEEDLARRDLTINAIARDEATGGLIDPFGGAPRPGGRRPAPREPRLCRGSGANSACRALRRAVRVCDRAGDRSAYAPRWSRPARSTRSCPNECGRSSRRV